MLREQVIKEGRKKGSKEGSQSVSQSLFIHGKKFVRSKLQGKKAKI